MLIDTHCHLSFRAFNSSWKDAVSRAREKDVQMICIGAARATSEKAITIAEESDGVFASIGLHPTHVLDEEFSAKGGPDHPLEGASGWDYTWYARAADHPKVVAIGETGIDHYHLPPHPTLSPGGRGGKEARDVILQKQEEVLGQHLSLAKEKDLPVILHSRDGAHEQEGAAYDHLYRIIRDFGYTRCVLHCYGGDWAHAEQFLDLGCMISFTGIVTYKNAPAGLLEVVKNVPLDRFMVETDSPYLAPEPMRGKQNEPSYVEHVARGIAQIRGEDYDTVARQTTENAKRFFNLP